MRLGSCVPTRKAALVQYICRTLIPQKEKGVYNVVKAGILKIIVCSDASHSAASRAFVAFRSHSSILSSEYL